VELESGLYELCVGLRFFHRHYWQKCCSPCKFSVKTLSLCLSGNRVNDSSLRTRPFELEERDIMCLASFLLFLPTSYHYFKLIRNFLFKFKMLVLTWFVNIRIFMELKMCLAQVYKTTVSAVVSNTVPLLY
jgi:hypothetical protein